MDVGGGGGLPAGMDPRQVSVVVTLPPKQSAGHAYSRDGLGAAVGSNALSDYGPI